MSTAGSTQGTVQSLDTGIHGERCAIETCGEHEERIATAAGIHIMPIGRKHARLFLFRIWWRRRRLQDPVTYKQEESIAAEP